MFIVFFMLEIMKDFQFSLVPIQNGTLFYVGLFFLDFFYRCLAHVLL